VLLPLTAFDRGRWRKRSHRRIRDLVAHTALQGLDANEIGCVRISIMAGSNTLRSKGRIQMRETSNLQISHIQLATHGRSIQMCQTATSRCWDAPTLAGRFLIGLPPLVRSDASAGGVRTMRKTFSAHQALEISPHIHVHRQQPLQVNG
jgi:hypothetical protein